MVETVGRDPRLMLRLCENELALQHRLGKQRRAFRIPVRIRRIKRLRLGEVGFDPSGVLANVTVTRGADRRMRVVGLLHHRAEQAGELGQLALQDCLAKGDVAEYARPRVG